MAVEWVGEEIETDWTGGREKRGMDGDGGLVAAYRHRGSGLANERTAEIKDCLHRDAVRRRFQLQLSFPLPTLSEDASLCASENNRLFT